MKLRSLLLPLIALVGFAGITLGLVLFRPDVSKLDKPPAPILSVETMPVQPRSFQVVLDSFGRVQPHTQGQLVAQVSGQIVSVDENYRDGGFFAKGDVLVTIDPRDYDIQVEIAEAELANAKVHYEEQDALASQAEKDRAELKKKGRVSDFALGRTQVRAAKSQLDAARAKLKKARLDVERTRISAPYAGRILNIRADLGNVVQANSALADIYATDTIEIDLPLKNSELALIDLPEPSSNGNGGQPRVTITNAVGGEAEDWPALVVRTAGAINEQSQQLHVTAQIRDPYGTSREGRRPLKIGQFVTARIMGKTIDGAIVIPTSAIYQGSYVYLYRDDALLRKDIDITWQSDEESLIGAGLQVGDELVLTPLGQVSSGTPVQRLGEGKKNRPGQKPGKQSKQSKDRP